MEGTLRIDRKYVLSNSQVNDYGYRLDSAGWVPEPFVKNPIGFYKHRSKDGVVVKWEDVQLEGEDIVGYPVLNMAHPMAAQLKSEIEHGFLNGASVGGIKFLETELEADPDKPGEYRIVARKWSNTEASFTENPGNRGAVALEDAEGNALDLNEFKRALLQKEHMKGKTLAITPELLELINLSGDAEHTEAAVLEGIRELKTGKEAADAKVLALETELEGERDKGVAAYLDRVIAKGVADKRITVALGEKLRVKYAKTPAELEGVIALMPQYQSINEKLDTSDLPKELEGKSYNEVDKADLLGMCKEKYPEHYKKLFRERFNKEVVL